MCHCISVYCIKMLPWYWNVYWYEDSWFCVVEMVHGVVALQEGYGIITDDIQRIDWWEVFMWCYRHYHLIYCLCGTVGPWVKVPKALEDDTPMWVYGVGPALGYESQKTRGMTCPWVMSQNSHYYINRVSCGASISNV